MPGEEQLAEGIASACRFMVRAHFKFTKAFKLNNLKPELRSYPESAGFVERRLELAGAVPET